MNEPRITPFVLPGGPRPDLSWNAWQIFDVEKLYIVLIVVGALGYLSNEASDAIERVVVPWRPRG